MYRRLEKLLANLLVRRNLPYYGHKNRTDKVNKHHEFGGKNYLDIFELYLAHIRKRPFTLVEIGIREGASLRTFRDYFKKAQIVGIDINPETAINEQRIKSYIGSQDSASLITKIANDFTNIQVVIDDGSHVNKLTIASFNLLFEKLEPGGYYIIEDLYCSYLEENLSRDIKEGGWPGMDYNDQSLLLRNSRSLMNEFFLELIRELDHRRGSIEYIHFWAQICIIKKMPLLSNAKS